jgi:hypothetical protein
MVISGTVQEIGPKLARLESGRVRLPPRFAKQAGLAGTKPIDCFLLVVKAGRYRLLTRGAVAATPVLAEILNPPEEPDAEKGALDGTDSNSDAAAPARLIPCAASPRGPGWRIQVPKEAIYLAPGADHSRVFLLVVEGFVELWFQETLQEAVSEPLSELLS